MSLFGEDSSPSRMEESQTKSIFGDSTGQNTQSNSLFQDDSQPADQSSSSPWSFPTPKKAASKGDVVKKLLPATDVPEAYVDVFDTVSSAGYRDGLSVSSVGVEKILKSSGLSGQLQTQVIRQVSAGASALPNLGRGEFSVLLALIGLAQEGEDATLDGVDERRKRLPMPKIGLLDEIKNNGGNGNGNGNSDNGRPSTAGTARQVPATGSPPQKRRQDSFNDDPWGSSANMGKSNTASGGLGGFDQAQSRESLGASSTVRTTSGMTNYSETLTTASGTVPQSGGPGREDIGWGNPVEAGGGGGFGADALAGGFGDPSTRPQPTSRALGGGNRTSRTGPEETIAITLLPDKEGMFMFQHRNYEVKSTRRGATVVRRYSDFVWLLDCLQKRYPFRQLPLLPPKRMSVNGRHLSNDPSFIEKRRRGLVRFVNALVRHPVLAQEQLVVMFLTVPTELAVWRKQATISVQEEFVDKQLPPDLEESLPASLGETFDRIREGVKHSAERYIGLCTLVERLSKRNQGVAADSARVSSVLEEETGFGSDGSLAVYAFDTSDAHGMNRGLKATAHHLATHRQLLEDEARAWDLGVLEDLKRHRDALVSVRDLFDRRDRFAKDNIPQLERRIESNEAKLANLRIKPPESIKPGEAEKVEQAILSDKQSIINQHARGVFIKECVRDELLFFQQTQYHVGRLHQEWSQERVKYAELMADNWRGLADEVEHMPTGE